MTRMTPTRFRKVLLLSIKIGVGSSIAIYIAQLLNLDYAISAGTVTLLTLMTTKNETVRLILARFVTLATTAVLSWLIFNHLNYAWAAYGLVLMLVVFMAESLGLRATISVNAVAAAHLFTSGQLTAANVLNECILVIIGVTVAMLLNLYQENFAHKRQIIANMRKVEKGLQIILRELASCLRSGAAEKHVWDDILALEKEVQGYIDSSVEYQDNTFVTHPEYYISYFRMRYDQCRILQNLQYELDRIQEMPAQANIIADYLDYLADYVLEYNEPQKQIDRLREIIRNMRDDPLPVTRDEFQNRALLYHVLMDIEDFLACKTRFLDGMDDVQRKHYWKAAGVPEQQPAAAEAPDPGVDASVGVKVKTEAVSDSVDKE